MDEQHPRGGQDALLIIGVLAIAAGVVFLAGNLGLVPPVVSDLFGTIRRVSFPLALVVIGVIVILAAQRRVSWPGVPDKARRLYRSRQDRVIAGACGGLAEYLRVDPLIMRLLFVLAALIFGLVQGAVAYALLVWAMPEQPAAVPAQPAPGV